MHGKYELAEAIGRFIDSDGTTAHIRELLNYCPDKLVDKLIVLKQNNVNISIKNIMGDNFEQNVGNVNTGGGDANIFQGHMTGVAIRGNVKQVSENGFDVEKLELLFEEAVNEAVSLSGQDDQEVVRHRLAQLEKKLASKHLDKQELESTWQKVMALLPKEEHLEKIKTLGMYIGKTLGIASLALL